MPSGLMKETEQTHGRENEFSEREPQWWFRVSGGETETELVLGGMTKMIDHSNCPNYASVAVFVFTCDWMFMFKLPCHPAVE